MRSTLLALCLACAFATGARAQLAYNFQTPDDIPASTSGAHPNILTMDCLAANGYGQWTSSSSATNTNGVASCFLLANKLNVLNPPSIANDAQEGVLAAKQFNSSGDAYPNEAIKCAANLKGNVRYVWMDNSSGRTKFFVEGFDPATTTNASTGIGIDFVSLPSSSSQKIVKDGSAILYGEVTLPGSGTLVTTTNESLYPDMFDIAIDASYLYIVWEQYSGGTYTIKAVAVNLTGTFSPTMLGFVGTGRRPTVAVDVRHSGGIANIDVVYLNSVPWQVEWTKYNGTSFPAPTPVPALTGLGWAWSNATHARIVDASAAGSGSTDKAIYFIAEDLMTKKCLFFNRITAGTLATSCDYCDGTLNTTRPSNCPIETSSGFPVVDDYVRAFADPYEGSTTSGSFDEFHCLYILNHTGGTINGGSKGGDDPLMIIPISDPSKGFCVSGGSSVGDFPDYDPVTMTTNEPFQYVGAVNQMGVHAHWTGETNGAHYYRRDLRKIDQDIEENTLLTSACEVSANVTLTNKWLTLYSDPSTAGNTGYVGSGALTIDNNVTLAINPSGGGGDFVQLGASLINFISLPGGILEVDADDQMDFYCNTHGGFTGIGEFKFTGSGAGIIEGTYGSWPSTISDPAMLNIHGGTVCEVGLSPFFNYFTAYDAVIHFNNETNVVTGTGTAQGKLILVDHSSFTNCWLLSDDNIGSDNPTVIQIAGNGTTAGGGDGTENADYNPSDYFSVPLPCATDTFNYCYFGTGDYSGYATISLASQSVAPNALIINNGLVEGVSIIGTGTVYRYCSPYWPISITDVTFGRIVQDGMDFSYARAPNTAPSMQYSLLVDHCGFQWFDNSNFSNPDGIKVEAAPDLSLEDAPREAITITNNTFESSWGESDGSVDAAIHFSDATGDIGYNNISGAKYQRGIWNESSIGGSDQTTWTLICSNTISGLTHTNAAGLSTDYYTGYAKMNSITDGYIGHLSGDYDNGNDLSETFTGNSSFGYLGSLNSITDMAGVHHPSNPSADVANYNVIKGNNSRGAQIQ
ncbi:MAG TPA: hypothetical protein VFH95_04415, partial [Candidatus Kapabacteria bacterium]|nr:hypothetical protein [Candidatus Kapabacteria bacterium]